MKLLGEVPQGCPPSDCRRCTGRTSTSCCRSPWRASSSARRGDRRHRPHVRGEARRPARLRTRSSSRWPPRTSPPGSAAAFPSAGGMSQSLVNEGGGRAHAALRAVRGGRSCLVVAVPLRSPAHPAAAGARGRRAGGGGGAVQAVRRSRRLWRRDRREFVVAHGGAGRRARLGPPARRADRRDHRSCCTDPRASRPHVAVPRTHPGTRRFSDCERHPDNELVPGVLIFRPESSLVYFNVDHVRDTLLDRVRAGAAPPRLVVLDLCSAPHVDMQSTQVLAGWRRISRPWASSSRSSRPAPPCARPCGERHGSERSASIGIRFTSVADVVDRFQRSG